MSGGVLAAIASDVPERVGARPDNGKIIPNQIALKPKSIHIYMQVNAYECSGEMGNR